MGFTTGFLGGVTLTTATLYFTVALHQRNRTHQSLLLRQQSQVLHNIVEPMATLPSPPRQREERVSLVETAKDKWNAELAGLVHKIQTTDWKEVADRTEANLRGLLGKGSS